MKRWFLPAVLCLVLAAAVSLADAVFAFEYRTYSLSVGKTIQLEPILQGAALPERSEYVWTSSDSAVATVSRGKVTGKKAGTATVTCSLKVGGEILYTTSCDVTVTQPIRQIKPEADTLELPYSPSRDKRYTYQLRPRLLPDGATGDLIFTSLTPNLISVTRDGLVTTTTDAEWDNMAQVLIEAADGSGVKAIQKIRMVDFCITVKQIDLTERKTYRLMVPTCTEYAWMAVMYWPEVRFDSKALFITGLHKEEGMLLPVKATKDGVVWFDVTPVKPGKTTIQLRTDNTMLRNGGNFTLTVNVAESACYTAKSNPKLDYKKASAQPEAYTGQPVSLSGKVLVAQTEDGAVRYTVATRGANEDVVIIEFPSGTKDPEFLPNEKVEVYGDFLEPVAKTTETGLQLYTLRVLVHRVNTIVYADETVEVDLYEYDDEP